jgi:hypothetical protein
MRVISRVVASTAFLCKAPIEGGGSAADTRLIVVPGTSISSVKEDFEETARSLRLDGRDNPQERGVRSTQNCGPPQVATV